MIDHIATNRPELASDSGVIPCGISDHDVVYTVRKTKLPKVKLQPKILTTRNFKNFDQEQFRTEVDNIPFDTIRDVSSDVNELWQTWYRLDFFLAILNKYSQTVTLQIRGKTAYVKSEIRKVIKQRDFLPFKLVTPIQVYDILKKLLNSKATDVQEIPNKILKACSNIKIMPCVEGDRSDCQPETSSIARSRRLRAMVVVEG